MAWTQRTSILAVPICLLAAILVVPRLHGADSGWTEVRSPHFDVITDAGEKRGHEVALRLEQMQAVFAGFLLRQELARPIPLTVIAIRGDKDYSAIAPRQPAGVLPPPAFVLRGDDRTFLVLNLALPDPWRSVTHELAHLFLEGNYPTTASWFDEGLAEYFSSIELDNRSVSIGGDPELLPERQSDLFQRNEAQAQPPKPLTDFLLAPIWISVGDLLTMQRSGPEGTHRTQFYAQSWMTIHYLLAQKKMTETGVFFDLLQNQKVPVEQAVQQAYGMSSKQFEQALRDYFKSQKDLLAARDAARTATGQIGEVAIPQPVHYPSPIDPETAEYTVTRLPEPEGEIIVTEMEARLPEHRSEAQATVEAFMKAPPETASEHRVLGWIAMETQKWDVAFSELGQAMDLNPKDNWARYYLVITKFREAQATNQSIKGLANALLDLRVIIDWYPEFAEAHNLLGLGRVEGGGITSAMQAEQAAIRLNPRHEQYQLNLAKIYTEGKKFDDARALLAHLKLSGDPQIAAGAKQQEKDLVLTQKYGVSPEHERMRAQAEKEEATRQAKEVAENARPESAPPDKRPIIYAKGRIVSVDCSQDPAAVVTFATGNRTLHLHTADHGKVIVMGDDKFSCRWEGVRAQANYKAGGKPGEGDLVTIEVQ
jgi:tetratricopeptide (TPR) repeat protein